MYYFWALFTFLSVVWDSINAFLNNVSGSQSEWRSTLECQLAPRQWVLEGDARGVQTEACGGVSVEWVAMYGAAQTLVVGAVYAQLVGAPRVGYESHECVAAIGGDGFVGCHSLLSMLMTHHLAWAVHYVGA